MAPLSSSKRRRRLPSVPPLPPLSLFPVVIARRCSIPRRPSMPGWTLSPVARSLSFAASQMEKWGKSIYASPPPPSPPLPLANLAWALTPSTPVTPLLLLSPLRSPSSLAPSSGPLPPSIQSHIFAPIGQVMCPAAMPARSAARRDGGRLSKELLAACHAGRTPCRRPGRRRLISSSLLSSIICHGLKREGVRAGRKCERLAAFF